MMLPAGILHQEPHPIWDPCRLWSLWEIMQEFKAGACADVFANLTQLTQIASTDDQTKEVPLASKSRINVALLAAGAIVVSPAGLSQSAQMLLRLQNEFQMRMTCADVLHGLHHLQELMKSELSQNLFLQVDPRDAPFFDKEQLFGDQVYKAFQSARKDITEAGNCLACGHATACIFHLMRAAEIALRVLAWDRRVKFVKRPDVAIELRQWDEILQELENAEKKIQRYRQSLAREAQLAFYHRAMIELRAFKNLYRHRTAHAREIYDMDQARSAMTHVSEFMKILATKISESKRTPLVWKKAGL